MAFKLATERGVGITGINVARSPGKIMGGQTRQEKKPVFAAVSEEREVRYGRSTDRQRTEKKGHSI
jgi:hypothetical protein